MRLKLRLPPSVNHMYVNARMGRRLSKVLSNSAKVWFQDAVILTTKWRIENRWETSQYKTIVKLWYYFPDHRRRDTHNTLKILMDALEHGGIYIDDKWALPQIINFEIDKMNPRVEIEFTKIEL